MIITFVCPQPKYDVRKHCQHITCHIIDLPTANIKADKQKSDIKDALVNLCIHCLAWIREDKVIFDFWLCGYGDLSN